jgi:hypothetical protein
VATTLHGELVVLDPLHLSSTASGPCALVNEDAGVSITCSCRSSVQFKRSAMSNVQPRQHFAATHRAVANLGAIEWEELPSLAKRIANRRPAATGRGANDSRFDNTGFDTPWHATMPVALDAAPVSQPFVERLDGLAMREVSEPDVFRHFFGPNADEN